MFAGAGRRIFERKARTKMATDEPEVEVGEVEVPEVEIQEELKAEAEEAPLDPNTALQKVLQTALFHDGLARGLHESVKALDRTEAQLCVLSSSCNEPAYVKLITALCKEHSIDLIKVENSKLLGEWAGLCKHNQEGKPVKVVGCSCVVIKMWGEETAARQYIVDHVKKQSA